MKVGNSALVFMAEVLEELVGAILWVEDVGIVFVDWEGARLVRAEAFECLVHLVGSGGTNVIDDVLTVDLFVVVDEFGEVALEGV